MIETIVQKQMRLLLEQQTAKAFMSLVDGPLRFIQFTLLGYDFGPEGNVAYKTTLDLHELSPLLRGLLDRWARGDTSVMMVDDPTAVASPELLQHVHDKLTAELPAGVGYSLVVGYKTCTGYLSNAERHGVIEMLAKLANALEEEAARD